MWKKTFAVTALLLGASTLWVGGVCLASVLVVGAALPAGADGPKSAPAAPATGAPKPAGSGEGPSKAPADEAPSKRRNG
ncbi:MAG TPA: hypothetical protein VFS43_06265 [Polyangiaceae bacterium]|nr:hypothetical protein [Polyangiaceae bacterium]